MPSNAYLGLYSDGEGPIGIIRKLPPEQTAYYRYLPMFYPYLIKNKPQTFVAQFSGGLSTALALAAGSSSVTVAVGDRGILEAFRTQPVRREFTGDILHHPVQVAIPEWNSAFCGDPVLARLSRRRVLERCVDTNAILMPAHFGRPHCGHVHRKGEAFSLQPVEPDA